MSLEQVFFRTWRGLSLPLAIIILLLCYYTLPDTVAIHHDKYGSPNGFIGKESFFYISGGIILGFNILMSAFRTALLKISPSALPQNNHWRAVNPSQLNKLFEAWANLFIALVNTYIIICLIGLNRINRTAEQTLDINYNWVLLLGVIFLMVIIFYLPLKLLYGKPTAE